MRNVASKIRSMDISKQQGNSLMETQFSELNLNTNSQENSWDDVDVNRLFARGVIEINLTSKSLTHSKKKSPAAMRKEIELQIMNRGDVSIEKVAEQFLVEGSEIENKDGTYTDDYIPTSKNIPADFLHNLIKTKTIIIMRRRKRKKGASKRRWFLAKGERWTK